MSFGKRVLEVVEVLSINDIDRHCSRKPNQLSSAGIGNDSDSQFLSTARHCATVL